MNTLKFFILSALLSFVFSCKVKQNESSKITEPALPLLEVAQKKFPGISQADLDEGQNIFNNDCSKCHGVPKIKSRGEEGWKKVVDWMAPKAKLNDSQKKKLLEFVLSSREQLR
ncbi:MAG: c-type cytochrome [Bacteroidota bacterium]|jgi:cytochrome c5